MSHINNIVACEPAIFTDYVFQFLNSREKCSFLMCSKTAFANITHCTFYLNDDMDAMNEDEIVHCFGTCGTTKLNKGWSVLGLKLQVNASLEPFNNLIDFPRLQELDLRSCGNLANLEMLRQSPNLVCLSIEYSTDATEGISNLDDLRYCTNLLELEIYSCPNKIDFYGLKNLPKLCSLRIFDDKFERLDELLTTPSPNLMTLSVASRALEDLSALKYAPNLQILEVLHSIALSDISPIQYCNALNSVNLSGNMYLSNVSVLKRLPRLTNVTITGTYAEYIQNSNHLDEAYMKSWAAKTHMIAVN